MTYIAEIEKLLTKPVHLLNIKNKLSDKKYLLQFLPERIEDLSKNKVITFKSKRLKVAYIVDLVHHLVLKYYYTKETVHNLSSLILKKKYGVNYKYYVEYMQSIGLLRLVSDYYVGKKTKTYEIHEDLLKDNVKRYKNEDTILVKKYVNNILSNKISEVNSSWIDTNLKQKLIDDLFYVTIDKESSMSYLDILKQDIDSYNKNKFAVDCIKDKHIYFHFDSYGRMHTNFTILKSFIRKNFLKIDGEDVFEVDIKNSQPLFLTKVIDNHELNFMVDADEYNLFKFLTIKGYLYQYLMDEFKVKDKREVKMIIYKVFFGRNRTKEDKLFRSVFPTIFEFIRSYKKERADYKALAYELQRSESNLIFNDVIKEIIVLYPEIRLFTIHDSIVFPIKYKKIVESIFYKKLEETFGQV